MLSTLIDVNKRLIRTVSMTRLKTEWLKPNSLKTFKECKYQLQEYCRLSCYRNEQLYRVDHPNIVASKTRRLRNKTRHTALTALKFHSVLTFLFLLNEVVTTTAAS